MEEREMKPREHDEPDVVAHLKPRVNEDGEREKKPRENDEPDVEAHLKPR
jgi:hypothetical protein